MQEEEEDVPGKMSWEDVAGGPRATPDGSIFSTPQLSSSPRDTSIKMQGALVSWHKITYDCPPRPESGKRYIMHHE